MKGKWKEKKTEFENHPRANLNENNKTSNILCENNSNYLSSELVFILLKSSFEIIQDVKRMENTKSNSTKIIINKNDYKSLFEFFSEERSSNENILKFNDYGKEGKESYFNFVLEEINSFIDFLELEMSIVVISFIYFDKLFQRYNHFIKSSMLRK